MIHARIKRVLSVRTADIGANMPYEAIRKFEETVAEFAGARYGVAVDSCTNALFLCCVLRQVKKVTLPAHTYVGVPCSVIHAGGKVEFELKSWSGCYQLNPYDIHDSALRFRKGMYTFGLYCLSFHIKKHLPIGRGGMILTNSEHDAKWLRRARFDGRREVPLLQDDLDMLGWNMYMTPEQASRGLHLFSLIKDSDIDDIPMTQQGYPDLRNYAVYNR